MWGVAVWFAAKKTGATAGLSVAVAMQGSAGEFRVRAPEVAGIHGRARPFVCATSIIPSWIWGLLRRVVRRLGPMFA